MEKLSEYVQFDYDKRIIRIINGTKGEYPFDNIKECFVLNEDAKYKGKTEPFSVIVKTGPLPLGLLTEKAFYVGVKIINKNGSVLAIYTSKQKTRNNTDYHKKDRKNAEEIKKLIDEIIT
ncbi:hypothetical protein [Floccifex sp.]|uniref:hypothetical protein n=1 Tax=Floccifex sp. TaxID=2815810 RepID=UPI002A75C68F|nr:hypothetical protein [Floccifex sp.]MDD7282221.1 hypothetical protein [Erysipelotrichaceae bacterium]MDY2957746.1 hypothetical protein [Floccifex sp.]